MASLHVMKHTKRGEHAAEPAKPKEHAGTIAEQFRLYMTFSLVELICVFTPVLVYIIAVLYLGKAERSVFDYPDFLFAAVVLSGTAACKYLLGYFWNTGRVGQPRRLFAHVAICVAAVGAWCVLVGMSTSSEPAPHNSGVVQILAALISSFLFLRASATYHYLMHPHK